MIPANNVKYAAKYLSKNMNRYQDTTKAIMAYNKGNAKNLTHTKYSDKVNKQWRNNGNSCRSETNP